MTVLQKKEYAEIKAQALLFQAASYCSSTENFRKSQWPRFVCFLNEWSQTIDATFPYFKNVHGFITLLYIMYCVKKKVNYEARHAWGSFSFKADVVTAQGKQWLCVSILTHTRQKELILMALPLIPMPDGDDAHKQVDAVLRVFKQHGWDGARHCIRGVGDRASVNMGPDGVLCLLADRFKAAGCTVGADAAHGFVGV
jgi:hypothetical protein